LGKSGIELSYIPAKIKENSMTLKELTCQAANWTYKEKYAFLDYVIFNVTIGIRSVWSNNSIDSDEKVDAIKWLNEFTHRVLNIKSEAKNIDSNIDFNTFEKEAIFYAKQNDVTKDEISAIVKLSNEDLEHTFKSRRKYHADESLFKLLMKDNFRKRTGMYISENKITSLQGFILGYQTALENMDIDIEETEPKFEKFNDWVASYYGWNESTAGWKNIILSESNNDEEKALKEFFNIFDKFKISQ